LDFARLRTGEIVAAAGGLALLLFMFMNWFDAGGGGVPVQDVPGLDEQGVGAVEEPDTGISGWDALTDFDGFLITMAALSGVALGILAAAGKRIRLGGLPRGEVTAFLGTLAALLILWRIFAQPIPGADLKIGIFLGLAAAVAIAVGALMALAEDGFEPLVDKAGGRARAARSSASSGTAKRASASRTTARKSSSKPRAKSSSSRSRSSSSRSRKK
jgi:hypothetical protein